jgi:hypothetical protein
MSGNAFCSCSLDVFRSIPVRETVGESSESDELPAVRFPPPPLLKQEQRVRSVKKQGADSEVRGAPLEGELCSLVAQRRRRGFSKGGAIVR